MLLIILLRSLVTHNELLVHSYNQLIHTHSLTHSPRSPLQV